MRQAKIKKRDLNGPRKQPAKKRKTKAKTAGQNGHPKKGLKYSDKNIIAVLKAAGGIVSLAGEKLGCARQTIYNRIESSKTVATAREEIDETNLDLAEDQLLKAITAGHMTAVIFYLKTKGRDRGYVTRQDINASHDHTHHISEPVSQTLGWITEGVVTLSEIGKIWTINQQAKPLKTLA